MGDNFRITVGIRSFRKQDSGPLRLDVSAHNNGESITFVGAASVTQSLAAGTTLESATHDLVLYHSVFPEGENDRRMQIVEDVGGQYTGWDSVWMDRPVNLLEPFSAGERDYLTDTDGDGVGDVNERQQGTVQVDIDESASTTDDYREIQTREAERHGADAVATLNAVSFRIAGFRDSLHDADGKQEMLIGVSDMANDGAAYVISAADLQTVSAEISPEANI